eukprot:TRINITY_DN10735_c0_g1_i1.p2 TRINITY_DN10735_c0_g1~~TRINITY_DN10735_c0_g1_i1.p2  ORF type:complete len:616 (+),score=234.27 TRINITY_DN10735_c0_g1_i1:62-1849(+)
MADVARRVLVLSAAAQPPGGPRAAWCAARRRSAARAAGRAQQRRALWASPAALAPPAGAARAAERPPPPSPVAPATAAAARVISRSVGGGHGTRNPLNMLRVPDEAPDPRAWHVRGGRGGTKVAPVHAQKPGVEGLPLDQLAAVRKSLSAVLGPRHRAVRSVEQAVERAAVLRRDWTDEAFQDGQDGNDQRVLELEREFEGVYRAAGSSLDDPIALGKALDLVGAYLKNYRIAKADAIMRDALPRCRSRGGVWLVKGLNHASTVLMKQQRHAEAYAMLRELESIIWYTPEEAPELWDMLFRNIGMALQSLNRSEEALPYFLKCATVKGVATWWDLWDVGYCLATVAFTSREMATLRRAGSMIAEALPLHKEAEPDEEVMHAKMLQALADCYLALAIQQGDIDSGRSPPPAPEGKTAGESSTAAALALSAKQLPVMTVDEYLARAEQHYIEAHRLFCSSCGDVNDLSGWCAAATALCMLQRRKHGAAQQYVRHALLVFSVSDIPKLGQLHQALDMARQCHTRTEDAQWLSELQPILDALCERVSSPLLRDEGGHLPLIQQVIGQLFVASGDGDRVRRGVSLLSGSAAPKRQRAAAA